MAFLWGIRCVCPAPDPFCDMVDYHQAIGAVDVFQRRQPTWAAIAAFLFGMRNQSFTDDDLIAHQRQLGRIGGETCLMELQPLPSPNTGVWHYGGYQYDAPMPGHLISRENCLDECGTERAKYIRDQLTGLACPPKLVVFYGRVMGRRFRAMRNLIVGQHLLRDKPLPIGETQFLLLDHPSADSTGVQRFGDWGRRMGGW